MRILVTGGCGFIGSAFIRHVLGREEGHQVLNLDLLTYAGNLENLRTVGDRPDYRFVRGDIADRRLVEELVAADAPDAIVNFAAETHVDRSIMDSGPFVRSNVLGTQVLLDVARARGVGRFLQISTDEVYGTLGAEGRFTEDTPLAANSPYSASKAAADLLCRAYHETFGLPVLVTRCSNNYGPYQFPEKLIPLMITNALADEALPVYGDGRNVRDWIHVDDHSAAAFLVLREGTPGRVYNVGAENECENLEVVRGVLAALGKPESLVRFVKDRPGHDRRYAIDATRIRSELGWVPRRRFEEGLPETVHWYRDNRAWWERVKSGEYRTYYERWYGGR